MEIVTSLIRTQLHCLCLSHQNNLSLFDVRIGIDASEKSDQLTLNWIVSFSSNAAATRDDGRRTSHRTLFDATLVTRCLRQQYMCASNFDRWPGRRYVCHSFLDLCCCDCDCVCICLIAGSIGNEKIVYSSLDTNKCLGSWMIVVRGRGNTTTTATTNLKICIVMCKGIEH